VLYLIYCVLGIFAGLVAGLFGVGGGIIIVPVLIYTFGVLAMPAEVLTHMAIGTSLACIVLTSLSSIYTHHKKSAVDWPLVGLMVPGIILGSWFGGTTAAFLSGVQLQLIIGVFAIVTAWRMWSQSKSEADLNLPAKPVLFGVSALIGWASSIFGIGGGSLNVPFLSSRGVQAQRAVASAAALGFPIALVGSLSFVHSGWGNAQLPAESFGFVYWPALLGIVIFSTIFARFGALLAHKLSAQMLKRSFAVFLSLVGVHFLLNGIMTIV